MTRRYNPADTSGLFRDIPAAKMGAHPEGEYVTFRDHRALESRYRKLQGDLAECYRLSGADPDGDSDEHLARYAVAEVRRWRREFDRLQARVVELEGKLRP